MKKKLLKMKMRSKFLIASISVFLIFILVTVFIWAASFSNHTQKASSDNLYAIINASNNIFEAYLKDVYNTMTLLSIDSGNSVNKNIVSLIENDNLSDIQLVEYVNNSQDYLLSLCSFKENLHGLTVSSFDEHIVTYGVHLSFDDLKVMDWYNQIESMQKDSVIFIEPHTSNLRDKSGNSDVISIVRPITSGRKVIGFVMADISMDVFDDFFIIAPDTDLSLTIYDNESGKIIVNKGKDINATTDNQFKQYLSENDIFHVSTLSDFTKWTIVGSISSSTLTKELQSVFSKLIFITLTILLLFVLAIFSFSRMLTRNIEKLTKAVISISEDNLAIDIDIHSKDEVEELYHQFQHMLTRIDTLISRIHTTENQKRTYEIKAMQAQINPHFLHNTLNTIKFLANLQGIKNISETAENLSRILKINLDFREKITFKEEKEYLERYIDIQSYRYTNAFQFKIICDDDVLNCYIPKLLIQPILENALTHGISEKENGVVTIKIYELSDDIFITVSDNGRGMTKEKLASVLKDHSSAKHIGLRNVHDRIQLYYGNNYGISIDSQLGIYTNVEIVIPKQETEGKINV